MGSEMLSEAFSTLKLCVRAVDKAAYLWGFSVCAKHSDSVGGQPFSRVRGWGTQEVSEVLLVQSLPSLPLASLFCHQPR